MRADESILERCLFFTSNRLANVLRRIVNDVYAETGIAAPHVYLLIIVNQYPEITITELSNKLDIVPSTCTRFVNELVKQGILIKNQEWKTVHVSLTELGRAKIEKIDNGLAKLRERLREFISDEEYKNLAALMWDAANKIELKN
ncbi:MAG: winged helix-turn-helix transcriptional regulator [Synergistaceae bacterium]|nr:winged helix-turn-helix transcriptional regulator [Synergistaceae bacterium]